MRKPIPKTDYLAEDAKTYEQALTKGVSEFINSHYKAHKELEEACRKGTVEEYVRKVKEELKEEGL